MKDVGSESAWDFTDDYWNGNKYVVSVSYLTILFILLLFLITCFVSIFVFIVFEREKKNQLLHRIKCEGTCGLDKSLSNYKIDIDR